MIIEALSRCGDVEEEIHLLLWEELEKSKNFQKFEEVEGPLD